MSPPARHVAAVAELERAHGRDAEFTATIHLPDGGVAPAVRPAGLEAAARIPVTIAVNGEPVDGWTGWLMPALDEETGELLAGAVGARHDRTRAHFVIAQLDRPRDGDTVYGTVAELIEHVAPMRNQG